MPVYIRRGELEIPVPSISSVEEDDQDSYLLDPAMVVDELPQPYRMLDKLLSQFLDDVWELITEREKKREEEARIVNPPLIEPSSVAEEFNKKTVMCNSDDERYAFVAYQSGELVAFDALNFTRIADWSSEEMNACFEQLHAAVIGPNIHLLAAVDDMGFARLFVFVNNAFYFVQLLNEQTEGAAKTNARKFDLSKNGDFCGLALESEGNSWLEIYKFPRDNWLREIESAQKDLAKRQLTSETSLPAENTLESPVPSDTLLEIKFSPIALVLKVKPSSPLTGNYFSSQQEAVEKAGFPNTVGNGTGHLFTDENLDLRRSFFKSAFEGLVDYDPKIEVFNDPTWHYLYPARMQTEVISSSLPLDDIPVSVCVWWKDHYVAQIYQLQSKPSKDIELKPDIVWPMSSTISSSAISNCTNIIAFGLENGFVSVIDRHLCLPRAMADVGQSVPVTKINILDSAIFSSTVNDFIPTIFCLLTLQNGAVSLLDCANNKCTTILASEDDKRRPALVRPFSEYPRLFLYSVSTGKTSICEIVSGNIICELDVTESLEEPSKRFDLSVDESVLYVKNDDDLVQSFSFREIMLLDDYQCISPQKLTFAVKETLEERCQRFLKQRILQQRERAEQLETNWDEMSKELLVLSRLKDTKSSWSEPSSTLSKWHRAAYSVMSQRLPLSR